MTECNHVLEYQSTFVAHNRQVLMEVVCKECLLSFFVSIPGMWTKVREADRRMTIELVAYGNGARATFYPAQPERPPREYYLTPSSVKRLSEVVRRHPKWKIVPAPRPVVGWIAYCVQSEE